MNPTLYKTLTAEELLKYIEKEKHTFWNNLTPEEKQHDILQNYALMWGERLLQEISPLTKTSPEERTEDCRLITNKAQELLKLIQ